MGKKLAANSLALLVAASLCSCSNHRTGGVDLGNWDKEAALVSGSSTATPEHSLPKTEYPFDAEGNYIAAWAASGERKFGHSSVYASASKPGATSRSTSRATPRVRYHKVMASDTLWGLSRKYGTTVSAIQRANGLSNTIIRTGATLKIPG